MRVSKFFLLTILLVACSKGPTSTNGFEHIAPKIPKEAKIKWVLNEYVDSIIIDKSIVKHRMKHLPWRMIDIDVSDSGIYTQGLINYGVYDSGNIAEGIVVENRVSGESYFLKYDSVEYQLTALNLEDSSTSIFLPSSKVRYYNSSPSPKVGNRLHSCFVQGVFKGDYINLANGDTVHLYENNKMEGIGIYSSYGIDMYLGTLHLYNNHDNVTFFGQKDAMRINITYEFEYKGDTLILSNFRDDAKALGDSYIMGVEAYKLVKLK